MPGTQGKKELEISGAKGWRATMYDARVLAEDGLSLGPLSGQSHPAKIEERDNQLISQPPYVQDIIFKQSPSHLCAAKQKHHSWNVKV